MLDKNTIPTKLLWVDLEMTGLDPATDRIVEIAVLITDFEFKIVASYEAVIHQPEEVIAAMNPWAAAQHSASGLTARIRTSGDNEEKVAGELVGLIKAQFGEEMAILAGNSIHNDRNFIKQWWPEVDKLLHYRMLDVSSLKILMQGKYGYVFEKDSNHRALDDIRASIAELQDYLEYLQGHDT
jgi:oligoribonuclease